MMYLIMFLLGILAYFCYVFGYNSGFGDAVDKCSMEHIGKLAERNRLWMSQLKIREEKLRKVVCQEVLDSIFSEQGDESNIIH